MTWQTTVVEPVAADRLTLMQITCTWCPWSEGLFDAATDDGRASIRAARIGHVCAAPSVPQERP